MILSEILKNVLIDIMENKFRVFLTTLGIIVGCATIILTIGMGNKSKADMATKFSSINATSLTISTSNSSDVSLDSDDLDFLISNSEYAKDITLSISSSSSVSSLNQSSNASITGVYLDYFKINSLEIQSGNLFNQLDLDERKKVSLIGYDLYQDLFPDGDGLMQTISIDNYKYQIVGILKRTGNRLTDSAIFIPFSTAMTYSSKEPNPQIIAIANDLENMDKLKLEIEGLLKMRYPNESFYIRDLGNILEMAMDSANLLALILAFLGSIVLLVGGIGIMNVLFVSVKERTKEIGILKALGASQRDILMHFLIESFIISLFGGLCGILLSIIMQPIVKLVNISLLLDFKAYLIGLSFSLLLGTIFGYYPALQASNLKTIDALKYE